MGALTFLTATPQAMFDTLDVSKAQATVEADRKRILAEIDVSGTLCCCNQECYKC